MSMLSISSGVNVLWRYSSCRNCRRSQLPIRQSSSKIANASSRPEELPIQAHWRAACGDLPLRSCRRLTLESVLDVEEDNIPSASTNAMTERFSRRRVSGVHILRTLVRYCISTCHCPDFLPPFVAFSTFIAHGHSSSTRQYQLFDFLPFLLEKVKKSKSF